MSIVSVLHSSRKLVAVVLLGLPVLACGCGDDKSGANSGPAAPATTPEVQANERAAREKAFGKAAIPNEKPAK
jgi:hypothetical protein